MKRQPSRRNRLTMINYAVFSAFILAAISQARVQVFESGSIIKRATETDRYTISRTQVAPRGEIFSSDGKPLAQDEDARILTIEFGQIPHSPAFFMDLAAATGIPASEFEQMAADPKLKSREWKQPMSAAQARNIEKVKTGWRADGISLARSGRRIYPLGEAASCFIGDMRDEKPAQGLEYSENKVLAGQNGKMVGLIDRMGNWLPMRLDAETKKALPGKNVTLTIDSGLQYEAAAAVKRAVETNKADQGVAIVIDPKTGDLLAMANWPTFDPSEDGQSVVDPNVRRSDLNPNYMARMEPGSMFKILTLAEALDKKVVRDDETIYCKGELQVGKTTIHCDSHHGNRAHGTLTPQMAIAKSCNVSAATWAMRIGYDNYVQYMEQLGVLDKTKLGVPGEVAGGFNRNEYAKQLQLATLGFGQSITATPVALAGAFSMLANDGKRPEPRLIKKVGEKEVPLAPSKQIITPETSHKLLQFMESVIETDQGTGKKLRIPGYRLGGKTGTAQKRNLETKSMVGGGYVANFVGFVPADKPRAVILVMIDHPKAGDIYGADVAGPVFVQLAKATIRRLAIPPSNGESAALTIPKDLPKATLTTSASTPSIGLQVSQPEVYGPPSPFANKQNGPEVIVHSKRLDRQAMRVKKKSSDVDPVTEVKPRAHKPRVKKATVDEDATPAVHSIRHHKTLRGPVDQEDLMPKPRKSRVHKLSTADDNTMATTTPRKRRVSKKPALQDDEAVTPVRRRRKPAAVLAGTKKTRTVSKMRRTTQADEELVVKPVRHKKRTALDEDAPTPVTKRHRVRRASDSVDEPARTVRPYKPVTVETLPRHGKTTEKNIDEIPGRFKPKSVARKTRPIVTQPQSTKKKHKRSEAKESAENT